jgi:hypothetical protein
MSRTCVACGTSIAMAADPRAESGGFGYWVTDEQLVAFARLNALERLLWLDDARRFVLQALTPEARERQERLRRGRFIDSTE